MDYELLYNEIQQKCDTLESKIRKQESDLSSKEDTIVRLKQELELVK